VFGLYATRFANTLRFRIWPDAATGITLAGKKPGAGRATELHELAFAQHPGSNMRPDDRLIGAALEGNRVVFARQATVEAAWRVVDPILDDAVPVHPYPRGTWGPRKPTHCYPTTTPGTTRPADETGSAGRLARHSCHCCRVRVHSSSVTRGRGGTAMGSVDRGRRPSGAHRTEAPRPRVVFAAAFALMVLDFADRQVVVATFPALQAEWGLSDAQLGALVSVVSVTVGLGAFPAALLVDRWSRARAIALMGTVWSLAAAAAGAAQSCGQLLTARAALGAGEAGYGPAAGALLATMFPPARRATVLGAFQAAAPLGAMLGVVIGGVVAAHWGWRAAFWVFVPPGLAVALLFLRVRDYPTLRLDAATGARSAGGVLRELFRARSGSAGYTGGAFQLVVVSTIYTWLPSQLNRVYGLPVDRAAAATALVILAGFAGMIGFAHVADRAAVRNPPARLLVPAGLAVLTAGLLTTAFAAVGPGVVQFLLILVGGATMTAAVGPVSAVVVDVVHPALRATAISTLAVVQNLVGLAVGPLLAGWLSDRYGLTTALAVLPLLCVVSAAMFWYGSRFYEHDRAAVPAAAGPPAPTRPEHGHS
jgi:MFS transporter, Spinster family, sphingosine-1-phosphate transporter